jgi:hypothetical protein
MQKMPGGWFRRQKTPSPQVSPGGTLKFRYKLAFFQAIALLL